jgi:hypothetical protein
MGFVRREGAFAGESSPSRLRFLDKSLSASILTEAVESFVIDLEGWTALFDIDMVISWQRATTFSYFVHSVIQNIQYAALSRLPIFATRAR